MPGASGPSGPPGFDDAAVTGGADAAAAAAVADDAAGGGGGGDALLLLAALFSTGALVVFDSVCGLIASGRLLLGDARLFLRALASPPTVDFLW